MSNICPGVYRVYKKLSTGLAWIVLSAGGLWACGGGGSDGDDSAGQAPLESGSSAGGNAGGSTNTGDSNTGTGGEIDGAGAGNSSTTGSGEDDSVDNGFDAGNFGEALQGNNTSDSDTGASESAGVPDGSAIEPVVTPSGVTPFSKFQLDDALYTNNVYDGRQLDADNNWQLIFYSGTQDYVRWEVPSVTGNNANPCDRPQSADPVRLEYRLTSRKDSPTERDTFVRAYPAMVVGTMGGRFESWGVECGKLETILPGAERHGGSPVYQMETVADATGLPVLAGELDYDIRVSVKADLNNGSAANGIANVFMDSYWHNVSDVSILPGEESSLINTVNGISSDFTEVWNLNIWFDYPRFRGNASQWTGGRKIGSVNLAEGGLFDVYFKIEGSRDGHRPRCRLGTNENCFLYIGLVTTDVNASRDGITVNYTEIAEWMRSAAFRDLFLNGAFETETPAARAYEAWRLIDGEDNDNNPDPARRGPRFPDENHVIGGIHLGSELWYNPDAEPAVIIFDGLGVSVEGKGEFGRYVEY